MTKKEIIELRKLDRMILKDYRGKWVAREGLELIAAADTLKEVLKIAKEKGVKKPVVWQVPDKTRRYSFY